MKIGVLGTGMVGQRIADALVAKEHEVRMGSRTADNERAAEFVRRAGARASSGTFADAAAFGEWVFNCTAGVASLAALEAAGADKLGTKILVDLSNPLDLSQGFPPTLSIVNDDSLGEAIQRAFPKVRVVKTLNTMSNSIMVDPSQIPGEHEAFVSGNDPEAKAAVTRFLQEQFGWRGVIDLGDITTCRGTEAWLLLWTRLYAALGHADFNLHVARAGTGAEG
ncbi:MAG: NAD(P)-binding domain-containing protein [Myxococcota bacterium]